MTDLETPTPVRKRPPKAKPTHYRIECYSMYTEDFDNLNRMVTLLKRSGWSKASKSHLIRVALARLTDEDLKGIAAERRKAGTR